MFKPLAAAYFASLASLCLIASDAAAKCGCPDDGRGAPAAATGLGQTYPDAPDLAPSSAWKVYEFSRDGIRYIQVNDSAGGVRAAVGRIGDTFWTMPIGSDADRVMVQSAAVPTGAVEVLYRSADTEVLRYTEAGVTRWLVRRP